MPVNPGLKLDCRRAVANYGQAMIKSFLNIFKVPELRNKVLFTFFMLMIYRIGYHVTLPGVDQSSFQAIDNASQEDKDSSAAGRLANYVSLFSGGNLSQS